jgi:hypothetical protein
VPLVGDGSGCRVDRHPAHVLPHSVLDRGAHESAPTAGPGDPIDLGDQVVVELYVQTHVLRLAPTVPLERRVSKPHDELDPAG